MGVSPTPPLPSKSMGPCAMTARPIHLAATHTLRRFPRLHFEALRPQKMDPALGNKPNIAYPNFSRGGGQPNPPLPSKSMGPCAMTAGPSHLAATHTLRRCMSIAANWRAKGEKTICQPRTKTGPASYQYCWGRFTHLGLIISLEQMSQLFGTSTYLYM